MVPHSEGSYKLSRSGVYHELIPLLYHLPMYKTEHAGVPIFRNHVDKLNMSLPKGITSHIHINGSNTLKEQTFCERLIKCSGYHAHGSRYAGSTSEVIWVL